MSYGCSTIGGVLDELEQLQAEAAKHVDAPLWALPDAELVDCLDTLHQLVQTMTALRAHVVRQIYSRGISTARGHRTTAGWLRGRRRLGGGAARGRGAPARAL